MGAENTKKLLSEAISRDIRQRFEPIAINVEDLDGLHASDIPLGLRVLVTSQIENRTYYEYPGTIMRVDEDQLEYWYTCFWTMSNSTGALNPRDYVDLIRRAAERRNEEYSDIHQFDVSSNDFSLCLDFRIALPGKNVAAAYEYARNVCKEIHRPAIEALRRAGEIVSSIAEAASGWSNPNLHSLLEEISKHTDKNLKGNALEELVCKLFQTIGGFTINSRIRTKTEEIDICIDNNNTDDLIWRREQSLMLAECKNWSTRCGKNDFVLFREKLDNRLGRCKCGFLISWNGFAKTVTKEMLRSSKDDLLIIPVNGDNLREAVDTGDFNSVLHKCWHQAVLL